MALRLLVSLLTVSALVAEAQQILAIPTVALAAVAAQVRRAQTHRGMTVATAAQVKTSLRGWGKVLARPSKAVAVAVEAQAERLAREVRVVAQTATPQQAEQQTAVRAVAAVPLTAMWALAAQESSM